MDNLLKISRRENTDFELDISDLSNIEFEEEAQDDIDELMGLDEDDFDGFEDFDDLEEDEGRHVMSESLDNTDEFEALEDMSELSISDGDKDIDGFGELTDSFSFDDGNIDALLRSTNI